MRTTAWVGAIVVTAGLLGPRPVSAAANKEHQQIMAEIRMMQEQQQQLQLVLGGLTETLRLITSRLDEQSGTTRKAFADQKLLIDGVAENARILRERADDTNVRLSKMTQEVQALRQTVASLPPPAPVTPSAPGDPGAGDPDAVPPVVSPSAPNVSPTDMWNRVYADYTGGQYDLAIEGFQAFIRAFPTSPQADDAQLYVGYSLYDAGKFAEAAVALRKVITDYPTGDTLSRAWYKLGQTYEQLKQVDNARSAYETVIQSYPDTYEHILSNQALERLKRRED